MCRDTRFIGMAIVVVGWAQAIRVKGRRLSSARSRSGIQKL